MIKFFKISKKKPILGPFWGLFDQVWQKSSFLEKRALSVITYFSYHIIVPLCQKSERLGIIISAGQSNWEGFDLVGG